MVRKDKTMTDGQKQKMISEYVEGVCNDFLIAWKDVVKVECKHDGTSSYIKVTTAFGFANYFDVTGMECDGICAMLCNYMSNKPSRLMLRDREAIREAEALFSK